MSQELEQARRRVIAAAARVELVRDSAAMGLTEDKLTIAHANLLLNFDQIKQHISEEDFDVLHSALNYTRAALKLSEVHSALEG